MNDLDSMRASALAQMDRARRNFMAAGVIYMPVILGLVALGAYVNRVVLRVLVRMDEEGR